MKPSRPLPLVYSCSGASSAAQMANYIAVRLDRVEAAEMSCIAGVGGDVKPLVRIAKSGRSIIALDGCPLQCAAHILKRHGLKADRHYDLSKMGVEKKQHEDFDPSEASKALQRIQDDITSATATESKALPVESGAPSVAGDEPRRLSSPVCYLDEFRDW